MQNNKLTSFNEGGSHENSKFGGVPIGGNNRVEQGETKNKNFIYSDRLYANEDIAKQFNLPGYIKGKTFANASKAIDNKFNGRSDIHSNATKKELLDRLSGAQEHLKQQEDQINQSLQANSQQIPDMMNGQVPEGMEEYVNQEPEQEQKFAFGGDLYGNPIDPPIKKITRQDLANTSINGLESGQINSTVKPIVKIQPGVRNDKMGSGYYVYSRYPVQDIETDREFVSTSGYRQLQGTKPFQDYNRSYNPATRTYGNPINKFENGGNVNTNNPYIMKSGQSQPLTQVVTNESQLENNKSNSNTGTYMAMAGQALGSIGSGLSANKKPMFSTKQDDKNAQLEDTVGKTKDSVAAAIGPWGQLFRGVEKAGQGVGDSVGGQLGDGIKTFMSPDETVMKMNSDSSISTGDKILGSLFTPYANLVTNRRKEQRQSEASRQHALSTNKQFSDNYAYGGNLKRYGDGGPYEVSGDPLIIPDQGSSPSYTRNMYGQGIPGEDLGYLKSELIGQQSVNLASGKTSYNNMTRPSKNRKVNSEEDNDKEGSLFSRNAGKFLKYAPVAMNAYQLSQLKKPDNKQLQRLSDRYNSQYVDESQLQNIVRQEGNNQSAAIQQMGGSEGSLRNALLATGLNKTKSLSDAYMKASELNKGQDEKAQTFNLGVNQFNAQTQHKESEQHEQNAAAYRNEKSKYLASIGTDLGSIGKEEVNKNQIAAALGYDVEGDYVVNKKTKERIHKDDFNKMIESSKKEETVKKNAYGGFINVNKIGRR